MSTNSLNRRWRQLSEKRAGTIAGGTTDADEFAAITDALEAASEVETPWNELGNPLGARYVEHGIERLSSLATVGDFAS